jgi:hypothetical protein
MDELLDPLRTRRTARKPSPMFSHQAMIPATRSAGQALIERKKQPHDAQTVTAQRGPSRPETCTSALNDTLHNVQIYEGIGRLSIAVSRHCEKKLAIAMVLMAVGSVDVARHNNCFQEDHDSPGFGYFHLM